MIIVLRLNHRKSRDKRVSTHVGLVSRAFGADKIIYSGEKDESLEISINKVVKNWGGSFKIEYTKNYKKTLKKYKTKNYILVHLTMYGLQLDKAIKNFKNKKDILIIVGGKKVSRDVYEISDYNISVTNQPHSEISALSLTLDKLKLKQDFKDAKLRIKPSNEGKEFY